MKLKDYKKKRGSIKKATLCLLVKDKRVLLAMKKRGFGVGRWNGVGGKVKENESIENAAVRETKEEIGILIRKLAKKAVLNFYFKNKPDFDQQVTVFIVEDWIGEPDESDEMKPRWFRKDKLPFKKMWWDDPLWLPKVLEDKSLEASFLFDDKDKVLESEVKEVDPKRYNDL